MKIRTNILIDEDTLRTAQETGLNVSRVCEKALSLYVIAMKGADQQIGPTMLNGSSVMGKASGGIRTRDPRLTKAEPHRARLPRRSFFLMKQPSRGNLEFSIWFRLLIE